MLLRQDEFRKHPLYSMLQSHSMELREYIYLKRQQQVMQKQKEF